MEFAVTTGDEVWRRDFFIHDNSLNLGTGGSARGNFLI
jgi:hypothetical protein